LYHYPNDRLEDDNIKLYAHTDSFVKGVTFCIDGQFWRD